MKQQDLTQGGIVQNIFRFALPYMFAYFLQILYGLADMFVIGQYCKVDSITAVSNGAQFMYLVTTVVIGLAMGTTVRLAHAVGAKDSRRAAQVMGNSVSMFAIVAIVLAGVLLLSTQSIVALIQTPAESVVGAEHYLYICFAGIPFIMAYNVIASIYRGLGDTQTPLYFVTIACVSNILLDYLFIGYCSLGPMGAALGTTLSQTISVLCAAFAIRKQWQTYQLTKADFKFKKPILKNLLKVGTPVALQDGFIQIAFIVIAIIANTRGLVDAAGVGIVEKFIGLLFIVPSAMLSTVSAVSAQNIGAGCPLRARQTMWSAMTITFCYGVVACLITECIPESCIRIFTDDAQVITQGADYLRSYAIDCALAGVHFCFSGFFTAYGYAMVSFAHNVASIVTARIPLSYAFSAIYPTNLFPMGCAAPIGSTVSIIICVGTYWWMRKKGKI